MNGKTINQPIISKVGGALLHVENLKKMAAWYGALFNIDVTIDKDIPFYVLDMDNNINLTLDDHRNLPSVGKRYPICQLKTKHIETAYKVIQEAGIPITLDLQRPHPGLAYFNTQDSEGNLLMICESDWINPAPIKQNDTSHPIKNHLSNIIIPVYDLERASEWYSKVLGFPIRKNHQIGGPVNSFDYEEGTGILLDDNRNNQDLTAFPGFMLKAQDINEALSYVRKSHVDVVRNVQHDHYFVIKDIEGNSIMIST
ncbi:VOC family protein [Sediminibacillus halophilus]|uniref:Glyoxalase/Bleomycin resistance protein/Dioxygenase superfamily protein n=1 Tax=Sediminibacillus halophilus TaxID=482461 RepID=A0A1G9ND13_9BACI|nr:VOC family protein [Sediminibacillus halophilus]SDL84221.1 Glyoxalase/Bleomycin resistance protein/Dioxygenase superfamily protein [Sediminibacillus halophilus]